VGEEDAKKAIDYLVNLINDTWEKRNEIEPIHKNIRPATPLEILKDLPKTNCGQCGDATCLSFALKVINELRNISDCPDLSKPEFKDQSQRIRTLLCGGRKDAGAL
jgi:ArsR family metal-binding transcriptional regulator